jgi:hypothetical protein
VTSVDPLEVPPDEQAGSQVASAFEAYAQAAPPGRWVDVPSPNTPGLWRSTAGLRTALTWLFVAGAAASASCIGAIANRLSVIDDLETGSASLGDAHHADHLVNAAVAVLVAVAIATMVVLIVWQWRGMKNGELLGKTQLRYTPGWSIAGWFIPFANFVIPVRVMQDLWQSGDPNARNYTTWRNLRRSPLVGWWWALFLIGTVIGRGSTQRGNTLDDIRSSNQTALAAQLFVLGAAILAIFMVRAITARQEQARHELSFANSKQS